MTERTEDKRRFVLLFRSPTEGNVDPYHQLLENEGYIPISVPVLKFNFINTEEYNTRLTNYTNYHCIVFTSQQAVKVTQHVIQSWTECQKDELVNSLLCYVVGKATAKAAKELGFSPDGEDTDNADCLSEVIVSDRIETEERPVLFPCSSIRRDTIPDRLQSNGIKVEDISVYETVHRNNIKEEVSQLIPQHGDLYATVLFSPSGVQALKSNKLSDIFSSLTTKMIAIGPTTQAEMEKEGITVFGTATKPDPQSLLKIING